MSVRTVGFAAAAALLFGASQAAAETFTPPVNLTPPTIAGDGALGNTLTTDGGTWKSAYPYSRDYEWRACNAQGAGCTAIQYETADSYVPKFFQVRPGATVRLAVTVWSIGGGATAVSAPVTIRGATAVMLEAPQVSGDARVGGALTVSDGVWTSVEPWALSQEWLRCWPDAPTSCLTIPYTFDHRTYVVQPLDAGWLIRAHVTVKTVSSGSDVITAPLAIPGPPPLRLQKRDADLGILVIGRSYDIPLWTGGTAPYVTALVSAPPIGMSVTQDGHLVGRPAMLQDTFFQANVTDATGALARDIVFTFRVVPPYVATHHLAAFTVNLTAPPPSSGPCAQLGEPDASGPLLGGEVAGWDLHVGRRTAIPLVQLGQAPYSFCTIAGSLPPGLRLDAQTGAVVGTPGRVGGYTVALAVVDAAGRPAVESVTIGFVVAPRPPAKHRH